MTPWSMWMIACTGLALAAGTAWAQDSAIRVATHADWAVFEQTDPHQCWGASPPKATRNTRDGRTVAVSRDPTWLFVSFIPDQGVDGQVSFTGGYPFREGSQVRMEVDGTQFEPMITNDEMAWAQSADEDARIVAAMKRGSEAVLSAVSSRGTDTRDTFSLIGFTAAVEDAEKRCGG